MKHRMTRYWVKIFIAAGIICAIGIVTFLRYRPSTLLSPFVGPSQSTNPQPSPIASPSAKPKPTIKQESFAEMNQKYGPCAVVPALMYHHVENEADATKEGHKNLTVDAGIFRSQMEFLKSHGYTVIGMENLINFFENHSPLPAKPVILTFDDGYSDIAQNAVPVLTEFGFKATLFIPTGLMNNPGYLDWNTISTFPKTIEEANHTWSHHSAFGTEDVISRELTTADSQLGQRGYNNPKVFAYPYGPSTTVAEKVLTSLGYKLAFTTVHGSTLCAKKKFDLPRIRIGNAQLSKYGL